MPCAAESGTQHRVSPGQRIPGAARRPAASRPSQIRRARTRVSAGRGRGRPGRRRCASRGWGRSWLAGEPPLPASRGTGGVRPGRRLRQSQCLPRGLFHVPALTCQLEKLQFVGDRRLCLCSSPRLRLPLQKGGQI